MAENLVNSLMKLSRVIASSREALAHRPSVELLDDGVRQTIAQGLKEMIDPSNAMTAYYPITRKHLERMVAKMGSPIILADVLKLLEEMEHRLDDDIEDRQFVLVERMQYYNNPRLFGASVFSAFPSANDDIFEAGMCLALSRSTACVMHLNRALECGLAALAKTVGVGKQNDWGKYISKIDSEIEARTKTSGARSADEQFYAEASANFDRLRRAYRNPTMHPEKTYSEDRAEEILIATKSFMAHLATRLSE